MRDRTRFPRTALASKGDRGCAQRGAGVSRLPHRRGGGARRGGQRTKGGGGNLSSGSCVRGFGCYVRCAITTTFREFSEHPVPVISRSRAEEEPPVTVTRGVSLLNKSSNPPPPLDSRRQSRQSERNSCVQVRFSFFFFFFSRRNLDRRRARTQSSVHRTRTSEICYCGVEDRSAHRMPKVCVSEFCEVGDFEKVIVRRTWLFLNFVRKNIGN